MSQPIPNITSATGTSQSIYIPFSSLFRQTQSQSEASPSETETGPGRVAALLRSTQAEREASSLNSISPEPSAPTDENQTPTPDNNTNNDVSEPNEGFFGRLLKMYDSAFKFIMNIYSDLSEKIRDCFSACLAKLAPSKNQGTNPPVVTNATEEANLQEIQRLQEEAQRLQRIQEERTEYPGGI